MHRDDIGIRANTASIIAYDKGTLAKVGAVAFVMDGNDCYLDSVNIVPSARGKGVATRLVKELLTHFDIPYQNVRWRVGDAKARAFRRSIDKKFLGASDA
jgi:ribosomal protein S18 acetylase RimI-like enzyme